MKAFNPYIVMLVASLTSGGLIISITFLVMLVMKFKILISKRKCLYDGGIK